MSETITASLTVSGGDVITAEINTLARGPAGPAGEGGSGAITSATTSDGTANLSISNVSTATGSVSGILTAPTAATTTSTTQVATTAFVQQELASGVAVAKNLEFLAHNGSGATIAKGSIVYINGAVGGVPRVVKAQANNDTNSARTIGFVKQDILDGANGFVIIEGELQNVSTADSIDIIGAGIQLYLSPTTPGAFTRTKPSAPQHIVYVGVVVTASTGSNLDGKILVGIQNGYELDEIHDVAISSPAAKQVIKRNAGNTLWINSAIVSADVSDATSAATANRIVIRDGSGGASLEYPTFGSGFQITEAGGTDTFGIRSATADTWSMYGPDYGDSMSFSKAGVITFSPSNFAYATGADALHRTALGSGATGDALFLAASVKAANETLLHTTKIKTTQTDRKLSTTYTTDSDFTVPVTAGKTYRVEFAVYTTATAASGFKGQFVIPSVPSNITVTANGVGMTTAPGGTVLGLAMTTTGVIGTGVLSRSGSATNGSYHGFFEVTIGTTGGNLLFQWAQFAPSADNTSVLANSVITSIERTP
jgi:hypothetical protein